MARSKARKMADGEMRLTRDGSSKLEANATGVDVTGTVTADGLSLGDNDKAQFGAGNDLQVYSDGSNSIIKESGSGNLIINGDQVNIANAADTEFKARFNTNGSVQLYYDNAEKLATTSTGVDVTGTVTADGLTVDGNGSTITTTSSSGDQDLLVFARPTYGEVGKIRRNANNLQILGESNLTLAADYDNDHTGTNSNVIIETDGTEKMRIDGGGNVGIGTTTPTHPLEVAASTPVISTKDTNNTGSSAVGWIEFNDSANTRLGYLGYGSSGSNTMFIRQEQDANIDFYVNGTRQGHINSSEIVLAGRKVNRARRTFEGYINTGSSGGTSHIMTYSRRWWGSGNTRIHIYENYYGPNSYYRMYELNGHTRVSHGGGAPTAYLRENYGGHCTVSVNNWDSTNQRADIIFNMPSYRGAFVVIETFSPISSSEPTGASNYIWINTSVMTEVV